MKKIGWGFCLVALVLLFQGCRHTPDDPAYPLASRAESRIDRGISKAAAKYWFYIRESQGGYYDRKGVHYSQVLECSQPVTTPGAFSKIHAVGPFAEYATALTVRHDELDLALRAGKTLIQRTAICDTRWD